MLSHTHPLPRPRSTPVPLKSVSGTDSAPAFLRAEAECTGCSRRIHRYYQYPQGCPALQKIPLPIRLFAMIWEKPLPVTNMGPLRSSLGDPGNIGRPGQIAAIRRTDRISHKITIAPVLYGVRYAEIDRDFILIDHLINHDEAAPGAALPLRAFPAAACPPGKATSIFSSPHVRPPSGETLCASS